MKWVATIIAVFCIGILASEAKADGQCFVQNGFVQQSFAQPVFVQQRQFVQQPVFVQQRFRQPVFVRQPVFRQPVFVQQRFRQPVFVQQRFVGRPVIGFGSPARNLSLLGVFGRDAQRFSAVATGLGF